MQFHLGKPILVMLVLAVISGTGLMLRRSRPKPDLTLWVFAEAHRDAYQSILPAYQRRTGRSVGLELITMNSLNVRLASLFMSPRSAGESPDAAEVEINFIARYLRPPVDQIGFLPLNHYLENSGFREIASIEAPGRKGWNARLKTDGRVYTFDGARWIINPTRARPDAWIDRISPNRFTPWMKAGQIFGVPHDVHPVALAYRADLFGEAGIDLESARTWPEFQERCLAFQRYWRARGFRYRHAMELSRSNCENLVQMLRQQHFNLFDQDGNSRINDLIVVRTLEFYAQLVAGPRSVGAPSSSSSELWAQDLTSGNTCCLFAPDWKLQHIRAYAGGCAGKLRMMPLPRFDPSDARTSTWGGTMIGIPRDCKHPDEAWKLIEYLYFSQQGLDARLSDAAILPPLPEEWDKPMYHQPDPFFGGQDVMGLYADLAREIPPSYTSPATPLALAELSYAVDRAAAYVDAHGIAGLGSLCQAWLDEAAQDIRRRIRQGEFSPDDRNGGAASQVPRQP